jgi:parallel beta-helix repeat protein
LTQRGHLGIVVTWGLLGLGLALLWLVTGLPAAARARGSIRYVATSGFDGEGCAVPNEPCRTVQYAVDAAAAGDVIKVAAGRYTDINNHHLLAQVAYVDKTITIRGGYTTTNGFADPPDPQANPTMLDAQRQGRVIYITGHVSPTIEGLRITGGDAFQLGGGLWGEDVGGGVYVDQSSATLDDNDILDNAACSGGGLYLWTSEAILTNNLIADNLGYGCGPLPGGGGAYLLDSSATLQGNLLTANRALGRGGGIELFNSDGTRLIDNVFSANVAFEGGGLYLSHSDASLSGNTVISNSAGSGGGLFLSLSNATFSNTVVAGNLGSVGSSFHVRGSAPRLLHTTLAGGAGIHSGLWITGFSSFEGYAASTVRLTNTILVDHSLGITVAARNTATLAATVWGTATWANGADWGGAGTLLTGTVNIWGDPAFVYPGAENYHIAEDSAARDAGLNAGVTTDLDGQARPNGTGYDIGADEFYPPLRLYLPLLFRDLVPSTAGGPP